jgi:hypothetical protein
VHRACPVGIAARQQRCRSMKGLLSGQCRRT